jgi:hypothetical protein
MSLKTYSVRIYDTLMAMERRASGEERLLCPLGAGGSEPYPPGLVPVCQQAAAMGAAGRTVNLSALTRQRDTGARASGCRQRSRLRSRSATRH